MKNYYLLSIILIGIVLSKSCVPTKYYAKLSNYWPPYGGTNCSEFINGECISLTASGEAWYNWIDKGCACPQEFPFYTKFIIDEREWICIDRGGGIVMINNNTFWLDLLTPYHDYNYGDIVEVIVK